MERYTSVILCPIDSQHPFHWFFFPESILHKLKATPSRICSIYEGMQYHSVSHIISTHDGYAVPVSHIVSTHEDIQCPKIISSVPVTQGYSGYNLLVSHILMGTADVTHGH